MMWALKDTHAFNGSEHKQKFIDWIAWALREEETLYWLKLESLREISERDYIRNIIRNNSYREYKHSQTS